MLSHRISFDYYCDLVKHTGQVFFLLRDEEINYSKGTHQPRTTGAGGCQQLGKASGYIQLVLPEPQFWGGRRFVFALLEGLSHICMSKIVRPLILAEP